MLYSPLDQFTIISYNMTSYIVISFVLSSVLLHLAFMQPTVNGKPVGESIFSLLCNMSKDNIGKQFFQPYLPLFIIILFYILIANLLGNTPYAFAITSHLSISVVISMVLLIGITAIALDVWNIQIGALFLPIGTPLALAPLLVAIESVSYTARAFSLGIRLAANIMAGHSLLHIIAGFINNLHSLTNILILVGPIALLICLLIMEIIISFLQAYVFTLLAISYLANGLYAS